MLAKRVREKTGEKRYCLVSRKDPSRILEWFGKERPSDETIQNSERRIQFWKHNK